MPAMTLKAGKLGKTGCRRGANARGRRARFRLRRIQTTRATRAGRYFKCGARTSATTCGVVGEWEGGSPSPFFWKTKRTIRLPHFRHGRPSRRPSIRRADRSMRERVRRWRDEGTASLADARAMDGRAPGHDDRVAGGPLPLLLQTNGNSSPPHPSRGRGRQNPKNNRQRIITPEQDVTNLVRFGWRTTPLCPGSGARELSRGMASL
jgi:hypothetical protein